MMLMMMTTMMLLINAILTELLITTHAHFPPFITASPSLHPSHPSRARSLTCGGSFIATRAKMPPARPLPLSQHSNPSRFGANFTSPLCALSSLPPPPPRTRACPYTTPPPLINNNSYVVVNEWRPSLPMHGRPRYAFHGWDYLAAFEMWPGGYEESGSDVQLSTYMRDKVMCV